MKKPMKMKKASMAKKKITVDTSKTPRGKMIEKIAAKDGALAMKKASMAKMKKAAMKLMKKK
tara:strand:- start:125 stop:310 length:186 start_codon:yes stop_codon:yes gene_type:complete